MNRMIHRSLRLAKWLVWIKILGNRKIATIFRQSDIPFRLVTSDGRAMIVGKSAIPITVDNAALLAKSWAYLVSVAKASDAQWSTFGPAALKVEVLGIKLIISTPEEAFILHEVFVEGIYSMAATGPVAVVDIGVNIGTASLYFASQPWVASVTGFEPLLPTYEQAKQHLEMNGHLADKIIFFNYGLADSDREALVDYSPTWKGSVGIYTPPQFVQRAADQRKERIRLRNASDVFHEILAKSQVKKTIVKMDCEGAEYEIVKDLVRSGAIQRISAFMIEWHDRGPQILRDALVGCGFVVWTMKTDTDRDIGLMYAVWNESPR
ncbi:MAG TPA: FkbM family methyltransferase [Silvibacterium sp.]|nr:FkbM family methyltransferase [Silvibacterium sp.]